MTQTLKKAALIFGITTIILVLGAILTIWLSLENSFWITSKSVSLTLENTEQLTIVSIDEEALHPHSIEINAVGKLNGQGLLRFGWNDTSFYHTDTINGDFNLQYKGDWYSDTTYFKYEHITATKGDLTIECEIFSSRK